MRTSPRQDFARCLPLARAAGDGAENSSRSRRLPELLLRPDEDVCDRGRIGLTIRAKFPPLWSERPNDWAPAAIRAIDHTQGLVNAMVVDLDQSHAFCRDV